MKIQAVATVFFSAGLAAAQAPPPAAAPTGGSPAYQRAGQLPARIMDFKAKPESIQPGQPVTLTWATENPTGAAIDPDLGGLHRVVSAR